MKRISDFLFRFTTSFPRPLGLVLACLVFSVGCTSWTGCKSTPATLAFKSVSTVEAGVKGALTGWADHVVEQRRLIAALPAADQASANASLTAQEDKVRAALTTYKKAAATAQAAMAIGATANTTPATAELVGASNNFLTVVQSFTR